METKCRAKDPNTCRTHGIAHASQNIRNLGANANKAVINGDADAYLSARTELDNVGSIPPESIPDVAIDAAAETDWNSTNDMDWSSLSDQWKEKRREEKTTELL